jgi:hypothetical protein
VVGGVAGLAAPLGVPCVAVVGEVVEDLEPPGKDLEIVSLVERFGRERAHADTLPCIEAVAADVLAARR